MAKSSRELQEILENSIGERIRKNRAESLPGIRQEERAEQRVVRRKDDMTSDTCCSRQIADCTVAEPGTEDWGTGEDSMADDSGGTAKERARGKPCEKRTGKFCKVCGTELTEAFLREFPQSEVCISRQCYYRDLAGKHTEYAGLIAGLPKRYRRAGNADFSEDVFSPLREALLKKDSVFLSGSQGIGKTHLAAALLNSLLPEYASVHGYDVLWRRSTDLLLDLQDSFSSVVVRTREIINRSKRVGLLIIDDFGAEKITEWSVSAIYAILAERIDELRPTIVTSNLNLDEIDRFEPRIASRLAEFATVTLPEVDRRLALCTEE